MERAPPFYPHVVANDVFVDVAVEVDDIGVFGLDEHRGMCGGHDPEVLLIHELH